MDNTEITGYGILDYGHGPRAWLNDIEIGKTTYLLPFPLMALNMFLIRQPFFLLVSSQGVSMELALHELGALKTLEIIVWIMSAVSIFSLLIPMIKFFEWKTRWIFPAVLTSILECVSVLFLVIQKNDSMKNTLVGAAYQLFSIDVKLSIGACGFVAVSVMILVCTIKMIFDIRENDMKYKVSVV